MFPPGVLDMVGFMRLGAEPWPNVWYKPVRLAHSVNAR
jgi:hypothetical protein